MFYIPTDWLKDPKNDRKVREILEREITTDINLDTSQAIKELEAIGETIIAEKLRDGEITID